MAVFSLIGNLLVGEACCDARFAERWLHRYRGNDPDTGRQRERPTPIGMKKVKDDDLKRMVDFILSQK